MKRFVFLAWAMFFIVPISTPAQVYFEPFHYGFKDGQMFISWDMVRFVGGASVSFAGDPTGWKLKEGILKDNFYFCPVDKGYYPKEGEKVVFYAVTDNEKYIPGDLFGNISYNNRDTVSNSGHTGYNFSIWPVFTPAVFDSTHYGIRDRKMFVSAETVSYAGGSSVSFAGDPTNWQMKEGKLEDGFFFCQADSNYVFPKDKQVVFYCAVDNGKFIPDSIRDNLADKTTTVSNGGGGYNFLIKPEMIGLSGVVVMFNGSDLFCPKPGDKNFSIWNFIVVSASQRIRSDKLKFSIDGTIEVGDLTNFTLWYGDVKICSADSMMADKTVTFIFTTPFEFRKDWLTTISLKADIANGTSGKTYKVSFRDRTDISVWDGRYGIRVVPNINETWKGVSASSLIIISNPAKIGVETENQEVFRLFQNYPNPFNPATNIRFTTSEPGKVSLEIRNIIGQKVEEITSGFMEAGEYSFIWDASRFSTGVYFCQVKSGNKIGTIKMTLMK